MVSARFVPQKFFSANRIITILKVQWMHVRIYQEDLSQGGTQESFIQGRFILWSKPYPFIYHILQKWCPLYALIHRK